MIIITYENKFCNRNPGSPVQCTCKYFDIKSPFHILGSTLILPQLLNSSYNSSLIYIIFLFQPFEVLNNIPWEQMNPYVLRSIKILPWVIQYLFDTQLPKYECFLALPLLKRISNPFSMVQNWEYQISVIIKLFWSFIYFYRMTTTYDRIVSIRTHQSIDILVRIGSKINIMSCNLVD